MTSSSPPPSYLPWLLSFSTSCSNSTIFDLSPLASISSCSMISSFLSISSSFSSKKSSNCLIFYLSSCLTCSFSFLTVCISYFNYSTSASSSEVSDLNLEMMILLSSKVMSSRIFSAEPKSNTSVCVSASTFSISCTLGDYWFMCTFYSDSSYFSSFHWYLSSLSCSTVLLYNSLYLITSFLYSSHCFCRVSCCSFSLLFLSFCSVFSSSLA